MALTDKLTAIADAIRSKTGGTGNLTLPQMASEISQKLSGNCKCFVYTASASVTSATALNTADAQLAAHYNDSALLIALLPISNISEVNPSVKGVLTGNRILYSDGSDTRYGLIFRSTATATTLTYIKVPVSNSASAMNVSSSGVITFTPPSGTPLAAGDYLVVYGWHEV